MSAPESTDSSWVAEAIELALGDPKLEAAMANAIGKAMISGLATGPTSERLAQAIADRLKKSQSSD